MGRILIMILLMAKYVILTSSSFPDNILPLRESSLKDISSKAFSGDDASSGHRLRHIQLIKRMKVLGETKIVICAREDIFIINPEEFSSSNPNDITYDSVVTWKSELQTRDLCIMKGQPDELCYNYNSVFEALDEEGNEFLVCGTDSYNPNCTKYQAIKSSDGRVELINFGSGYFSGKQRCPFGPNQPSASLFTGESLYSGTFQAFSGGSPVISRTMGGMPPLRTPDAAETINEPSFVGMAEDEDRVFIFFNEIQILPGGERRTVAQVGQICKRDNGGERVLQRMWTTFIKSRLNCSYNGFYLNELRDITKPTMANGQAVIYATFVTPENSLPGSAVCSYTLDSIREALQGPFLAQTSSTPAPSKSHHPGLCPDEKPSDAELLFIKSSPQMANQAKGLLLMTHQGARYTTSVVDSSPSDKDLKVFYIGDEEGKLIRRLAPSSNWKSGAVLSVQDVFDENRCLSAMPSKEDKKVIKILLDSTSDYVTVAFKHCTVSVPLHSCHLHQCKSTCIGSGDPYCGWNGTSCVAFQETLPPLNQDLRSAINSPQLFPGCAILTSKSETSTQSLKDIEKEIVFPDETLLLEQQIDDKDKVGPEELGDPDLEVASFGGNVLAIAVILTFMLTVVIIMATYFFCRCWRGKKKYDFHQKQMMQHQQNLDELEKRGSLTRKAQLTYNGCLEWLCGPPKPTPAPTPMINNKSDEHYIPRAKPNNYSEAPTLQLHVEKAKKQRRSSSRLNSTSSVNSNNSCIVPKVMRQESVVSMGRRPSSLQPLLINQTYEPVHITNYDGTIQRQFSEASTLPAQNKRSSHASSSGSGGSPISNESHLGAAETGVLPTASAKMRRRNERAQNQTNEIMRESDTAIMDFQNALGRMEIMGITNHHQPVNIARQRLDSNDSGKGESPRNSLRTDLEQSVASITSRHPRPNSLNLQRSTSCRRQRLLSEPSHSPEAISAFAPPIQRFHSVQPQPQMTPNGRHSRSQPTTPVGGPSSHKLVIFQPAQEQSVYATLPKHDVPVTGRRKQRMSGDNHQQMYIQQRPVSTDVSNQRRSSTASRPNTSPAKVPPNRYPSLQVRGPYATKPSVAPVVIQQPASRNSPPKNHYPSLPHRSSSAPFGNNNTFERPSTLHRREKMPSFLRQSSMPGGAPTKPTFYPPPIVPTSGVEAL
uniref:Uncharacterized protein LOC104266434 n=1 Tax=Phallusia mammillata TaxID=59560 RepID=A0A6F9DJQ7_9ASCI|nr:uncharacterized protein LOC104266434 [Phallusia mammillata]